jgi:hypothetical protein
LGTSQNETCSGCCREANRASVLDSEHENRLRKKRLVEALWI